MANDGVKITAQVSIDDVRTVLGSSSNDVGYLCSNIHGKTNKWAKHKPVPNTGYDTTSVTYKGHDGRCGLTPPLECNSKDSFLNNIETAAGLWAYTAPNGSEQQPFRLTDFDGYNHKARSPFGTLPIAQVFYQNSNGFTIQCLAPMTDATSLSLNDFAHAEYSFGDWYFGILLCRKSGSTTTKIWATSTAKTSEPGGYNVHFNQLANTGVYDAYPFLCNGILTETSSPSNLKVVGIENTGTFYEIANDGVTVSIAAYYTTSTKIVCRLFLQNKTSHAITVTNGLIQGATNSSGSGETTLKNGITQTVNANDTVTQDYVIENVRSGLKYVRFYAASGSQLNTQWIGMMEEGFRPIV